MMLLREAVVMVEIPSLSKNAIFYGTSFISIQLIHRLEFNTDFFKQLANPLPLELLEIIEDLFDFILFMHIHNHC